MSVSLKEHTVFEKCSPCSRSCCDRSFTGKPRRLVKRVKDLLEQSRRDDRGVLKKDLICWTCARKEHLGRDRFKNKRE
ncbi:hypothetical protein TNCV_1506421 [Trichonephila clavipes]|nr:hypothetical protein TNCV_1506421 [Trichonephila clavipes]